MILALFLRNILFLREKNIKHLTISKLMDAVKIKSVPLNIYYMVGDSGKNLAEKKAENFGNIFFDCINNSFSIYVLYLENVLRIYLNLVSPINELIIENYLPENRSVVKDVFKIGKVKEKITKRVFDCIVDVGKNLVSYLNIVLDNVAFEHTFLTFKPGVDYNSDSLKILKYEGVLSLHKGSNSANVSS